MNQEYNRVSLRSKSMYQESKVDQIEGRTRFDLDEAGIATLIDMERVSNSCV